MATPPAPITPPPPTRIVDQTEAAAALGLTNPRTLAAWRVRRCGPPFMKVGKRLVRYDLAEVMAWAAKRGA